MATRPGRGHPSDPAGAWAIDQRPRPKEPGNEPEFRPLPADQRDRRETVLFLHCSGSSAREWAPVTAALEEPVDAVPLDLIGYGADADAWPADAPLTLDHEADRLAHWLQGPRPVHLVGHSYGATVALQLALRWPTHVRSLTLYEPARFALLFARRMTRAIGEAIVGVGRNIGARVKAGRNADAAGCSSTTGPAAARGRR